MITLRNDFHGTIARVRPTRTGYLSPSQVRRVLRKLCPSHAHGCACGIVRGGDWDIVLHRDQNDELIGMVEPMNRWADNPFAAAGR